MLVLNDRPVRLSSREAAAWYIRFLRDPLQTLIKSRAKFGPFIQLPYPTPVMLVIKPRRTILVAIGPAFNSEVLGNPAAWRPVNIGPGGKKNSAARRLSMGIIRMTGERHAYYRRLLLPPLQRRSIDANGSKLVNLARESVGNWPVGQPIDLWANVRRLTRTFAIGVLFGDDREYGYPISDMITEAIQHNLSWKTAAFQIRIPGTPYDRMMRLTENAERRILAWAGCKRGNLDERDLLSIIVNKPDENGCPASDQSIVGHTPTLFGAAYETCQNAMIWTLILLDQHPEIARDLYSEIQQCFSGGEADYEQLMQLPLLDAVIKESMRILPPVPQQFRVAQHETTIGGIDVKKGTRVLLSPFLTNREPDLYPNPDCFRPQRWAAISPTPYENLVFSAGPRSCPGYAFGIAMLKVGIATIMSHYRIAFPLGTQIDYQVRIALSPKDKIPAVLARQDGVFAASAIGGTVRTIVRFPD
jgi:cytochrome P450